MAESTFLKFIIHLALTCGISSEYIGSKTYYMDDWDDKILNMNEKGIFDFPLKLSRTGVGAVSYVMDVMTSPTHLLSVHIVALTMGNCNAKLTLYNYDLVNQSPIVRGLCRDYAREYLTNGSRLVLEFESGMYIGSLNNNFKMIITSFRQIRGNSCDTGYLDCGNGRCIPTEIMCNGRDNCGTGKDEENCPSNWSNGLLITLGVICVLVVIAIYFYKSKRCRPTIDRLRGRVYVRRTMVRSPSDAASEPSQQPKQTQPKQSSPAPLPAVLGNPAGGSIAVSPEPEFYECEQPPP